MKNEFNKKKLMLPKRNFPLCFEINSIIERTKKIHKYKTAPFYSIS